MEGHICRSNLLSPIWKVHNGNPSESESSPTNTPFCARGASLESDAGRGGENPRALSMGLRLTGGSRSTLTYG